LRGYGFAIEAKAKGEKPTSKQELTIKKIRQSDTPVFVIDGVASLTVFNEWCQMIMRR
jgi:hypothetical protein